MRLAVRVLGVEVLAVELGHGQDDEPFVEHGPPFGFTGSIGGVIEHADHCPDIEASRGRRP